MIVKQAIQYKQPKVKVTAGHIILLVSSGLTFIALIIYSMFQFLINTNEAIQRYEITKHLNRQESIQEHLGKIESITHEKKIISQNSDYDILFHCKGEKQNADVKLTFKANSFKIKAGTLILEDNEINLDFTRKKPEKANN